MKGPDGGENGALDTRKGGQDRAAGSDCPAHTCSETNGASEYWMNCFISEPSLWARSKACAAPIISLRATSRLALYSSSSRPLISTRLCAACTSSAEACSVEEVGWDVRRGCV